MEMDAKSILEYLQRIEWKENNSLRLFWVKISHGSRDILAQELKSSENHDVIVPLVLRETLFLSANAVMADFSRLLESNRKNFESLQIEGGRKITVIILLKENFKLSQISSPVVLPRWFPVLGGTETYLHISDLMWNAELDLLNCNDAQIGSLASALYELESTIVERIRQVSLVDHRKARPLIDTLFDGAGATSDVLDRFEATLRGVPDPKGYRPNSQNKNSLISLLFSMVMRSSPDALSKVATNLCKATDDCSTDILRPTLFAIMLRPSSKTDTTIKNWHSILLAAYQVYQLMNAAAHAGDYPKYPATLIHANSRDLIQFLHMANQYVGILFAETEIGS
ncbi:hypothetical protein [Pseudomonas sp. JZ134]|uniref:hypothetical protein n=1 Tax=Pseudomonas sp. JZ134 TaxID=2806615 RepID=UPI003DA12DE3